MIDHDRALELAASALDFPVSDADRAALQEHLDGCMDCRARDEQLRTDARRVADLPLVSAPDALRMRVLDAAAGLADVNEDGIVAPAAFEDAAARPTDFPDARPPNQIGEPVPGPMLAHRYRRPVAGLFTAAAIVALISGVLFWQSSPNSGPGVAASSPSAAVPSGSGPTSPGGGPSSPIASETWAPVADLTADDLDGGVVGRASSFRLASLDGTSATTLAAHLTVVPPVAFAVVADADGRSARITPNEPLTDGALYRFTLTADDGRTLDSWAFQARQPLHVVSTLPADSESGIPTNTGIEVTFDQDGVMDGAAHMTIEPKIAGRFEQHGRTLAFVPARRLAAGTLYAVSVHSGVTVKGTGEALESDVRFRFETAPPSANGKARTTFQFSDDVVESATVNRPAVALWAGLSRRQGAPTAEDGTNRGPPARRPGGRHFGLPSGPGRSCLGARICDRTRADQGARSCRLVRCAVA